MKSTKQKSWKKACLVKIELEQSLEKAKQTFFTETQAKKCLDDILESLGQSHIKDYSVRAFFKSWIERYSDGRAKTYLRYKQVVKDFEAFLADKADISLSAITPSEIEGFKTLLKKQGLASGSINVELKILRAAFNVARRQGYILKNPVEAVDLLKPNGHSHQNFSRGQIQKLLDLADWEMKGMILIGCHLGLRIGDVAHLTWGNVDLEKQTLTLTPAKTGKPQIKPIVGQLLAFLRGIPQGISKTTPLFPRFYRKKVGGKNGLSSAFQALMHQADIDRMEETGKLKGKGRRFFALGFHSLRASATSFMANQDVSEELRMKIIGHESKSVHDLYTHMEMDTLRKAASAIPYFKI